ncbi:hypothetical protein GCM10022377_02460 [Zhihengliuella alba]|uniref:Uncharacterized protein n=1 Tax=Zhihengliuella alba TaxID=547018 RepID=A0ABP7CMM4_9MICC
MGGLKVIEAGHRVVDVGDLPAAFKPEAFAHAEVLERLRDDEAGADWFFLGRVASFGTWNAERTGVFSRTPPRFVSLCMRHRRR